MLKINTNLPGQQDVKPQRVQIVTDSTYDEVTTAGFLTFSSLSPYTLNPTDIVDMLYGYDETTRVGTYQEFTVNISNEGVITLVAYVNPANVELPVTDGNFASFNGDTGQIADLGFAPSDATKDIVAMVDDNHGVGQFVVFTDANGTIGQSGGRIFGTTTAVWGGGGTSNSFSAPSVTPNSIIAQPSILTSTNAVSIVKITPGTNSFTAEFSADPGANTTLRYIFLTTAIVP